MKKLKESLRDEGWDLGTCAWQMSNELFTLECYLAQKGREMRAIILQEYIGMDNANIFKAVHDLD